MSLFLDGSVPTTVGVYLHTGDVMVLMTAQEMRTKKTVQSVLAVLSIALEVLQNASKITGSVTVTTIVETAATKMIVTSAVERLRGVELLRSVRHPTRSPASDGGSLEGVLGEATEKFSKNI